MLLLSWAVRVDTTWCLQPAFTPYRLPSNHLHETPRVCVLSVVDPLQPPLQVCPFCCSVPLLHSLPSDRKVVSFHSPFHCFHFVLFIILNPPVQSGAFMLSLCFPDSLFVPKVSRIPPNIGLSLIMVLPRPFCCIASLFIPPHYVLYCFICEYIEK